MSEHSKSQFSNENYQYHVMYLPRGIERLEKIGTKKIFQKNTELTKAGDIPSYCYVVRSGSVIAYEYTYTGDRRVYNIMEPGSIFLEDCCLTDRHWKNTCSS